MAISADDWPLLAEAGVFSLTLPEPEGVGLGLADAVVVFEELGRALIPGPLVGTFLAAAAGLVDGAAEGQAPVGVHWAGDGPILVEHLASLDALLVLSGPAPMSTARLSRPPLRSTAPQRIAAPLCPLTPMWHLDVAAGGRDRWPTCGPDSVRDGIAAHRRTAGRSRRRHARPGRGLRQGAPAVRQAHRELPSH